MKNEIARRGGRAFNSKAWRTPAFLVASFIATPAKRFRRSKPRLWRTPTQMSLLIEECRNRV